MLQEIIYHTFWRNSILNYLICLTTFIIGIIAVRILKKLSLKVVNAWTEKTATPSDDFLVKTIEYKLKPLLYWLAFYLSIRSLDFNPTLEKGFSTIGLIFFTILGGRLLLEIIIYILENYWKSQDRYLTNQHALYAIVTVVRIVFWGLAFIILLDNLGIKISALLAGLGIGGIAIAFAAQAILVDMFSYVTIFFDRPFEIGDLIIIDNYVGTVEHIGIKTTRLRSLSGEQLIFSNTDLTNSRVRNYKRMENRRVVFQLGLTYETKLENLKEVPLVIEEIIKRVEDTVFDRAHFFSYGDFSLNFEIVYYINGNDYNKYMNIQQEINFAIKEEFAKRGIQFAYPTQTLFLNQMEENSNKNGIQLL